MPTPETDEPLISAPATPPVTKVRLYVAPVTAPMVRSATLVVALVLSVVAAPKVIEPKLMAPLVLLMVPLSVLELGAVAVKPPVKAKVPPLAPSVKVPVLLKVTALVIVPVVALSARLYPALLVFRVVAVSAPLKVIAPVVSVKVTVVAPTVLLKVVPPELVMVSVPTLVPTAPLTVTAPVVLMVRFALPVDGPVTVVRLIGVAAPAPIVRLLLRLIAPVVI